MFTGSLYGFQEEAFDFMVEHKRVLVALSMGLGKSVVTTAVVEHLVDSGLVSSGLIIAPRSLKFQWKYQIEKFTDGATVLVIDGTPTERREQYRLAKTGQYDYVILNYEQVVNDWQHVQALPRDFMVCDEVSAIKGFRAKRSRCIKKLNAPYKFGLTGQPVENRAEELFSIMQWVNPNILGRWDIFDQTFVLRDKSTGRVKMYKRLPLLRKQVSKAMIRKTRDEVKDQLPAVLEELVLVDFDPPTRKLYRLISKDLLDELHWASEKFGSGFSLWRNYHGIESGENEAKGRIMSKLTTLRMLCDSPELVRHSAHLYDTTPGMGSEYAADLVHAGHLDKVKTEPKFDVLEEVISDILSADNRNKIVLFSFFKTALRRIGHRLVDPHVFFTGDMTTTAREAAKRQFQEDPDMRLFLSSDAGGYGIDLPQANYLLSVDLPWSAGKLDQRNSRIIRLSSEFESITLVSLLIRGSVEERLRQMLEQKSRIASAILDGKGIDRQGKLTLDLSTLTKFLESSEV